jgi:hypothetical protein
MVTKSFSHTAECELEVHCSPFGLSGLYVKLQGSDAIGIGSTMARLTGFTTGKLHYNKPEDLIGCKFKLYGLVEDNDILRIDFIKIFTEVQAPTTKEKGEDLPFEEPEDEGYEMPDLVFRGKVPAGRPDVVEPFIGIFNFEKPPNAD